MINHRDPHTRFPSYVSTPSPLGPFLLSPTYMVLQPPVPAPISTLGCPLFRRKSKEVIMEKWNFVGLVCTFCGLVSFYFQLNMGTLYAAVTVATTMSWAPDLPGFHVPVTVHPTSPCLSALLLFHLVFPLFFPRLYIAHSPVQMEPCSFTLSFFTFILCWGTANSQTML